LRFWGENFFSGIDPLLETTFFPSFLIKNTALSGGKGNARAGGESDPGKNQNSNCISIYLIDNLSI
jgi:hypothetical protein